MVFRAVEDKALHRLVFLIPVIGLSLTACQSSKPQPASQVAQDISTPRTSVTTAVPAPPVHKAKPIIETARLPQKPERVYPEPDSLTGVGISQVFGILGEPEFIRKDHPAEIWQYRGQHCTLDIFLYQATTGIPHKVDYIETRPKPGGPSSNKNCLISILKGREKERGITPESRK
jgi:hypothetical protein